MEILEIGTRSVDDTKEYVESLWQDREIPIFIIPIWKSEIVSVSFAANAKLRIDLLNLESVTIFFELIDDPQEHEAFALWTKITRLPAIAVYDYGKIIDRFSDDNLDKLKDFVKETVNRLNNEPL